MQEKSGSLNPSYRTCSPRRLCGSFFFRNNKRKDGHCVFMGTLFPRANRKTFTWINVLSDSSVCPGARGIARSRKRTRKGEGGRRKWKISVYARNRIIYRAEILKAEDCRRPGGIDTP